MKRIDGDRESHMEIEIIDLPAITVIGKEGLCTADKNIAQQLWQEADAHFHEVDLCWILGRNE